VLGWPLLTHVVLNPAHHRALGLPLVPPVKGVVPVIGITTPPCAGGGSTGHVSCPEAISSSILVAHAAAGGGGPRLTQSTVGPATCRRASTFVVKEGSKKTTRGCTLCTMYDASAGVRCQFRGPICSRLTAQVSLASIHAALFLP
jgi:hypothetical protein